MQKNLTKIGSSLGIIIDKPILDLLRIIERKSRARVGSVAGTSSASDLLRIGSAPPHQDGFVLAQDFRHELPHSTQTRSVL